MYSRKSDQISFMYLFKKCENNAIFMLLNKFKKKPYLRSGTIATLLIYWDNNTNDIPSYLLLLILSFCDFMKLYSILYV